MNLSNVPEFTRKNSREVAGLKFAVLPDPRIRFFQDELHDLQGFFLLPNEAECFRGLAELIRIRLGSRQAQAKSIIR